MNDNQDAYTNHYMIDFSKAISLIDQNSAPVADESVELKNASGRILSADIYSPMSIPNFDNSAMDGYAVCHKDLQKATRQSPIELTLAGLSAAGDKIANAQTPQGTAWKIMTGAPVPKGYDAIIPVENTSLNSKVLNRKTDEPIKAKDEIEYVSCYSSPDRGAHIRSSGEDFLKGQLVLKANTIINSNRVMALASLGVAEVPVKSKPTIAVFSTGKELVDDPTIELQPGQIRNSNMPYIIDYLKKLPVDVFNAGTNYDDVEHYQKALQQQLDKGTNLIISTGAVSMGDFDFIPQTIIKMGGTIIFHKSKIRPGKPILFAKFPNGSYYFGLPGNPISATIGLRFFVSHLILRLINMPSEQPIRAKLENSKRKKLGFKNILKAHASIDENGYLKTSILAGQESFKIHPLIDANGWVILSESTENAAQNDPVDYYFSNINFDF